MMYRHLRIPALALAGASIALSACGGSSSSSAETTAAPNTTPWRTLPPVANTEPGSGVAIEGGVISYKVRSGDYFTKIAKKAGGGCTASELMDFNPDIKLLIAGGIVKIPASCLAAGVTEETINADDAPIDGSTDVAATTEPTTTVATFNEYIVVKGDYAFGIVKKTGCSYSDLKKANPGKMSNLKPKMKLKVPVSCDIRDGSTDSG